MRTRFEYIRFVPEVSYGKTFRFSCKATKRLSGVLGIVIWYPPWRQYCYSPGPATIYSSGCLTDIQTFLGELNAEHQSARAAKGVSHA